jgi:signal transduction histidine kinase
MATLLSGVLILSIGVIAATGLFLKTNLMPLVTSLESSASLQNVVVQIASSLFVAAALFLLFVFWAVGHYIADPLRKVTALMDSFSSTGIPPEQVTLSGAPSEIRHFATSFSELAVRVEESHKHDTEISRVKSDFISTAAHQLRTPLTGIRWALEALELEQLTEGQKALVASATEKSHQLVAVVGTLLDISSIESGKYKYVFTPMDLNALVDEVTRDFEPMAVKAHVSLLFEKSGIPIQPVQADRERMRWVLNNLIENAIRYTPAGGTVRITTESLPERAYVRVRDTGIGIAPEDRGNIFERFYRAPNAITKENGGNGLGLYIARTIATDHGGELSFSANEAGPGTTFTLSLPFA